MAAIQLGAGRPEFYGSGGSGPAFTNFTVDASNDGCGAVFQAQSANAITHLGFRYGARTLTPPTYRISLQTPAGATGMPDGTVLGGGSPASATFTPPADTSWDGLWQWIALDNAYTPTQGQLLALVIEYSSGTLAGNFSTFGNSASNNSPTTAIALPYAVTETAGTWAKVTNGPVFGVRTASERYGYIVQSVYSTRTASTVGHRAAMKFTLPAALCDTFKLLGFTTIGSIAGAGGKAPIAGLWSASSLLQSMTLDSDVAANVSANIPIDVVFSSEVTLTAGTTYYVGFEVADAASAGVIMGGITVAAADDLLAFDGGTDFILSTYNGSTWSDTTTVRPMCKLRFSDITEPSASGAVIIGGRRNTMIGR